jgi:anti-anti-sigma factor
MLVDMSSYGLERSESEGGTARVVLSGELDLTNARELEEHLASAAGENVQLEIDLNRVSFVDSAALHVLFKLARRRGRDGLVVVLEPGAQVAATLSIVGLDRVVTMRTAPDAPDADGS